MGGCVISNARRSRVRPRPERRCGSLDIEALAEGIETQTQARALALFGCDYGQGYFSSVPLPADAMTSLIGRQ